MWRSAVFYNSLEEGPYKVVLAEPVLPRRPSLAFLLLGLDLFY